MPRLRPRSKPRLAERASGATVRRQASVLRAPALEAARRSRRQLLILAPLIAAIVLAYAFRKELFGADEPVRLATAGALIVLGRGLPPHPGRPPPPHPA